MKRKTVKADEFDVTTRWRRILVWRRGEVSAVKRRMRRRERHDAQRDIDRRQGCTSQS